MGIVLVGLYATSGGLADALHALSVIESKRRNRQDSLMQGPDDKRRETEQWMRSHRNFAHVNGGRDAIL